MSKITIYQVLPRLFGNYNETYKINGDMAENGCGKFNSFTPKALTEIKNKNNDLVKETISYYQTASERYKNGKMKER